MAALQQFETETRFQVECLQGSAGKMVYCAQRLSRGSLQGPVCGMLRLTPMRGTCNALFQGRKLRFQLCGKEDSHSKIQ